MVNIVADAPIAGIDALPPPKGTVEITAPRLPEVAPEPGAKRLRMADMLPMAAVALAIFGTTLSAVGLATTSRTVAEARRTMDELHESQRALTELPQQLKTFGVGRPTPTSASASASQSVNGAEATRISAEIEQLRADIGRFQAQQGVGLMPILQNSQAELANRLNEIAAKVDRIDRALAARGAAQPAVRPSRSTPPAGDRAHSS